MERKERTAKNQERQREREGASKQDTGREITEGESMRGWSLKSQNRTECYKAGSVELWPILPINQRK